MGTSDIKSTPPVTTILLSMAGVDMAQYTEVYNDC